jgi:RHS repeat-associated protein
VATSYFIRTRGKRRYELSNHLGNVQVVVSDRKIPIPEATNTTISYFTADIVSATDYYAFGAVMSDRSFNAAGYRFGFNGKENDNEVKGTGNQQDYGMRIYDPRLGKFLSVDPLTKNYPWYTPYQFAGNKPINSIDLDGAEEYDSYESYSKAKGSQALSKDKMDGSDGAWLSYDRVTKNSIWANAMATITRNNEGDKLVFYHGNGSDNGKTLVEGSPFAVVKDYYNWVQHQIDSKGLGSQWAKGASYLVDELDKTQNSIQTFTQMYGILADLNKGIAKFAVGRFKEVLYDGAPMEDPYVWDSKFVWDEQVTVAAPSVYSKYAGTDALNQLAALTRGEGLLGNLTSGMQGLKVSHYIPSFSTMFDTKVNVATKSIYTNFGAHGRYHIPMYMLYPEKHQEGLGGGLTNEQYKAVKRANTEVNQYYINSMKY